MANPLDNNFYKFYLNFKNEDSFGLVEITEPIKFDGASFIIKQDSKRYGRDAYKINEDIDLYFYKGNFDVNDVNQQLPNGTIISNLTMGFDYLIDVYKRFGYESEVEFIINNDGIEFITGVLDFQTSETDLYTYLTCKIVQSTEKQLIKRREDYVVNMFSDEDADGNYIEPLTTTNILLKAKPVVQESEWLKTDLALYTGINNNVSVGHAHFQSPIVNPTTTQIENTLSGSLTRWIDTFSSDTDFYNKVYDNGFVDAIQDLTNNTITLTDVKISYYIALGADFDTNWANTNEAIRLWWYVLPTGLDDYTLSDVIENGSKTFLNPNTNTSTVASFYSYEYIGVENVNQFNFPDLTGNADRYDVTIPDITITLPNISNGSRLCLYYDLGRNSSITNWLSGKHNIIVTSTAIDTVIKGIRYIDLIKQTTKSISGLDVYSKDFDVDGTFYSQFGFTGNLIKGRDDVAFPLKFKDIIETIQEVNQDYQILNDKIYLGDYSDFYTNKEIGVFVTSPDDSFKSTFNNRFALNVFEYKYKKYEQDKDEQNTIDAVHTDTQWTIKNRQVENKKTIELNQIRDPFKIEFARKEAVKSTTSTTDDDNLFLIDVVELAPSTIGGFTASLTHYVNSDGNLQLLNDNSFSWSLLGFGLGDSFEVISTNNNGTYTVDTLTDNIITLVPVTSTPTYSGVDLTQVEYPYTNVLYTNRTNEGFDVIENIASPDKFSNLKYTIKRNIQYWKSFLSSAVLFTENVIKNSYFKNNGDLTTKLITETTEIVEDANFNTTTPLLTPYDYKTRLIAPFSDMLNVINSINTINEDLTIAGFIRCIDTNNKVIKIYPKELEYSPSTETLILTGEERFESDVLTITIEATSIIINEVGYDIDQLSDVWYVMNGDYLIIYDINGLPVINPTKYSDVEVNGFIFDSAINLMNYLTDN